MAVRFEYVTLQVGTPTREWCDRCLTTACLAFPVVAPTSAGVSTVGVLAACTRCDPGLRVFGESIPWPEADSG